MLWLGKYMVDQSAQKTESYTHISVCSSVCRCEWQKRTKKKVSGTGKEKETTRRNRQNSSTETRRVVRVPSVFYFCLSVLHKRQTAPCWRCLVVFFFFFFFLLAEQMVPLCQRWLGSTQTKQQDVWLECTVYSLETERSAGALMCKVTDDGDDDDNDDDDFLTGWLRGGEDGDTHTHTLTCGLLCQHVWEKIKCAYFVII